MSAAVIKIAAATTTATGTHTSATAQPAKGEENNRSAVVVLNNSVDENSSFCRLDCIKKEQISHCSSTVRKLELEKQQQHNNVPLENCFHKRQLVNSEVEDSQKCTSASADLDDDDFQRNHYDKHVAVERDGGGGGSDGICGGIGEDITDLSSPTQLSPGLSLLQQTAAAASSPPPHSYRHSRAYRHFKNPPQPHMCIRTTTEAGEELFINVLSWTRIVIPQEPSDPIPLYGGMRVPPGSPRSPPIVFAVMANPEVLKDSGRHSKDPEERRAMVELMCDFVEAMNPGVKLVRNAVILKDRDISGELKDVWNAVQAQRDREREEQMMLQRQQHQQHFHHSLSSSSSSTINNSLNCNSVANSTNSLSTTLSTQQMFPKSVHSNDMLAVIPSVVDGGTPPRSRKLIEQQVQNKYINTTTSNKIDGLECENAKENNSSSSSNSMDMVKSNNSQFSLSILAERLDNKLSLTTSGEQQQTNELQINQQQQQQQPQKYMQNILLNDDALITNGNNSKDSLVETTGGGKNDLNNQLNTLNSNKELKQHQQQRLLKNGFATNYNDGEVVTNANDSPTTTQNTINTPPATASQLSISPVPSLQPAPPPPTKKEKLGGFLPNGCIFPRFTKNNKHKDKDKDKDKDKEKETKTKDKEKNVLLSALKKSKDKKSIVSSALAAATTVVSTNHGENNTSANATNTAVATNNCCSQIIQQTSLNKQQQQQQQKNCLPQLECGVQKIDLNNHHHHHRSANITENTNTTINKNNTANNKNNSSSSVGVQ